MLMSAKRLLPLAALFIIVVIAGLVLKRRPAPTQLADETGFERLVPPTLQVDSIRGVDLSLGTQPENVVRLRRQENTWVAASYYNAPVQTEKLSAFLTTLSNLEGELRTDQAELLQDFRLDDAQALHLRLYTETFDTPAVHLLAGKGSGRQGFMRRADSTRVYSVTLNVHNEAGLTGDAPDQQLAAKPWLDLHIQDVPKEQITAVTLQTPERSLQFAWQPSPSAAATSQESPPPATPPQGRWALTAPQGIFEPKQSGLDSLVNTLRTLRADDIANPDNMAAYGLEQPAYRATLTVQAPGTEARDVSLLIGAAVPDQADKRYSRLDDAGPIYILPAWVFRRLFPPAKELLELPSLEAQSADVQRVTWRYGEESGTLEPAAAPQEGAASQPNTAWRLAEFPDARLDDAAIKAFFAALSQLTADDWVDRPAQPTGLDHPQVELHLTLRDNRTVSLALGQSRGSSDAGYYASLLDHPGTFVVSTTAYTALTEALSTLRPPLPSPAPAPTQP
jgi:hypothetical protein